MDHVARRPLLAVATLTTASALALTPIAVAPPTLHAPTISAAHISTQAVQLADAWTDLATNTVNNVVQLGKIFVGAESGVPLPSPTIFLAPIATQLVLNQLIYLGQLFSGQGAKIPGEITTHLTAVLNIVGEIFNGAPGLVVGQLQTPVRAIRAAIETIADSSNPLTGLFEAPAVFLDVALNSEFGLLAAEGPLGFPLIVRNAIAKAIDPPLPGWLAHILQPGKAPSAAALTPKSTVTLKVAAPSHSASSNRSTSKTPSAAADKTNPAKKASRHNAEGTH